MGLKLNKTQIKNTLRFFRSGLVLLVLAIVLVLLIRVYLTDPKDSFTRSIAKVTHLPVALVGGHVVSFNEYYSRLDLAEKLSAGASSTSNNQLSEQTKSDTLNFLVEDAVITKLLAERNISVSDAQVEQHYNFLKDVTFTDNFDFNSLGLSESKFKNLVVRPELERAKLETALAGDSEINKDQYALTDRLQKLLGQGAKFSDLAQQYSQDPQSAEIGGEMGLVGYNDVVPEIYQQLQETKDHNVHVLTSRFGLHVYMVTSQDDKGPKGSARYNLKQIYIKTADFDSWFAKQKESVRIIKLK